MLCICSCLLVGEIPKKSSRHACCSTPGVRNNCPFWKHRIVGLPLLLLLHHIQTVASMMHRQQSTSCVAGRRRNGKGRSRLRIAEQTITADWESTVQAVGLFCVLVHVHQSSRVAFLQFADGSGGGHLATQSSRGGWPCRVGGGGGGIIIIDRCCG